MAGGFFRRYFQDYTEDRRPVEDGRMQTSRVYRGFLYAPRLAPRQRAARGVLLPLLTLGGGVLFILGAMQRAVCNTLWYTALTTGASLIALLGTLLAGDRALSPALLFALSALCEAATGEIERRIPYERKTNPNA